jgi:hypothetical protein
MISLQQQDMRRWNGEYQFKERKNNIEAILTNIIQVK